MYTCIHIHIKNTTFQTKIQYLIIGEKKSGKNDQIFEWVTKFFPDQIFSRLFSTRLKLFPDFFSPDQNISPIFYSPTKILTKKELKVYKSYLY